MGALLFGVALIGSQASDRGAVVARSEDELFPLVLIASSRALQPELRPLLSARTRKELRERAEKAKVTVHDYGSLGIVVEDEDPLGLEARANVVAVFEEVVRRADEGQFWVRFEEFPKALQPGLSRLIDGIVNGRPDMANISDKTRMPLCFQPTCSIKAEFGGKSVTAPMRFRGLSEPPDPRDYPVAKGLDPDAREGKPELVVHRTAQFHSSISSTAIAKRTALMRAYLQESEQRALDLYNRWEAALERYPLPLNTEVPQVGARVGDLPAGAQAAFERLIAEDYQTLGFASPEEGRKFLAEARVTAVKKYVQVSLFARIKGGYATGMTWPIDP
jgi:hypothetical protein